MARIDRLPEAAKAALQIASVVGREFTARLVERVTGAEHETTQALGELRAVELIYEKALYPELAYLFKHALTHDVAYDSLLKQRRRALHQRVGEAIEALYGERLPEFYATLAWHYVRGETWPKAVDYLLKAAEQARVRYAYAEAMRQGEEAAAILERYGGTPDEKRRAFELLGDLQSLQGHVDPANQAYDHALECTNESATRQRLINKRHRPGVAMRDGARIAYYEHGTGEPTLVLTHPVVYGLGTFQPILELLCQEFRIITIDPRGTGRSAPLPGVYLVRDHMEDARAVIEATGNRPVVFIGISRTGAIAVNFAATYPRLVEKLVLIGTHHSPPGTDGRPVDPNHWTQRFMAVARAGDREQAFRVAWETGCSEPGSRDLIESFVRMSHELPWEVWENYFVEDPGRDLRPLLPALSVPTLVLHGESDHMIPLEAGHYLADHIPDAQFYLFKGRCHAPMFTATVEFAQVVRHFIRTGRPT
jgi:pimeloyl-ACP methyl ester carboxylesterase